MSTYEGGDSVTPTSTIDLAYADERRHRQELEKFHGQVASGDSNLPQQSNGFLETLRKDLNSGDRFLKTACRNAFFSSEILSKLTPEILNGIGTDESTPDESIGLAVALARAPTSHIIAIRDSESAMQEWRSNARKVSLSFLQSLRFEELTTTQKLNHLRALSLVFLRLGAVDDDTAATFSAALDSSFPSGNNDVDRELCQMLVYLNSPTVVSKAVALMKQERKLEDIDMADLLARNAGYGSAINAMIANQPDKQQIWYAFCLRVAKVGWTPELRADYFRWFGRAKTWSGGNSFRKFLQNIENELYETLPENQRVMLEAVAARTPFKVEKLPTPVGPGKEWTLEEVRTLAADGMKGRNFKNGQKMFAATRCILCHRFAGDGGATGPDLTQLAGRFNIDALTEALMDPSKVISDQYRGSSVLTAAGKTVNGRIVSENDQQISVLTDPEDSTKIVDIRKDEIDEIIPSKVSLMPGNLLKPLNQEEVLDLLAYLLSRGDEKSQMFRK